MRPDQLPDEVGAVFATVALGLTLGGLAGIGLFMLELRRQERARWPR